MPPTDALHPRRPSARFRGLLAISLLALVGCPDEPQPPPADLGSPVSDDMSCYTQPTTHLEILNACTSAQSVSKQPVLPLLRADGTLPPLP
ncbi:MAG TPA: hypothetical protein PKI03_04755 [Pseudomonadota bacterium]|nr:hypothetical protein [Pseudomonadota bacterium]